jgi:hypothetical protein
MRRLLFGLWLVVSLIVLGACAPAAGENTAVPHTPVVRDSTVVPSATGLSATLQMPTSLPDGGAVKLRFTLTNSSATDLYVLKWYTPLEGIGGEIFHVERDGRAIPYTGILAMRDDPTPESYVLLEAGHSASAEVDLAEAFDLSQPGKYTIEYVSPRISHVARSEAEMARSVDELGPVDIPSNTVTLKIGVTSGEPAGTPAGDALRTLKATGQPLPHSMKGYELYSWYEADEGNWYFTLITGTNRLKTLAEIRAGTDTIRPGGWARITVRGDGPLKTLLRRLPQGEQVTWNGPDWLHQVGAGQDMIETTRYPDPATVAEIRGFCEALGVDLSVTDS